MKNLKNLLLISAVIFIALMSYSSLEAKKTKTSERLTSLTDEEIERIESSTWRVELGSNVKDTYFGALQFTVFETDPMPLLREQKRISEEVNQGRELTELDKIIDISTSWDLIFMGKTGAEVYLLKAITKKDDTNIISASSESGKKWIVTKSVQNKDGSISAWAVPFDAKIGKTISVELNDSNKFDFSSI